MTDATEPHNGDSKGIFPGKVWQKSTSQEHPGWSPEKLSAARAFSEQIGSAAVMIVDDGIVVDAWGELSSPYKLHSIRKPLMSSLIGIHVEMGNIDLSRTMASLGIDDNSPSLSVTEKQATVYDLIRSRSGVYHPALGEVPSMKAARPRRHSHPPGTFWYYNNWDFNALGTIFEQETGTRVCEEFDRRVAKPLLMEDFDVERCWYRSDSASIHRYYGIRMSARDLARFGLLYLRKGRWQDRQIVSPEWVTKSTATHSSIRPGTGYGYMWKTGEGRGYFPNVKFRDHVFGHSGLGIHFLIVVPYRKLVIVHRVDTDNPGSYPGSHELDRLMWLILDAAGETDIGENPSIDATSGVRVTADNLDETLGTGTLTVRGTFPADLVEGGDRKFVASLFPDHSVEILVNGVVEDKGKWGAKENKVCIQLDKITGGKTACDYWVVDEQSLKLFDFRGTLLDAYTLSRN
jgi:CubicO group peptidase (beta-lactamase class C family)